ncbi:MAG TPA: EamA family transporter RarD [Demequinaceae bacterium]
MTERLDRQGLIYAFVAYGFWGVFPIFMDQLRPAGALEIVAHRALWSLAFCAILVVALRRWRRISDVLRDTRTALSLALAALLLAVNWGVFIYAVLTERVADSSLGYYINPLITVALGVVVLRERLHKAQAVAMGLGLVAVAVLGVEVGGVPWIAPTLALSFGAYALLKKRVGATVDARTGFAVETLALLPVAVVLLLVVSARGDTTWGHAGLGHDAWLASTGAWTAGALLVFAAGAARLPLYVMGLIQYLTPTMTFILAVAYFHENMSVGRWLGFGLVWVALTIITVDTWRRARASAAARAGIVVTEPE